MREEEEIASALPAAAAEEIGEEGASAPPAGPECVVVLVVVVLGPSLRAVLTRLPAGDMEPTGREAEETPIEAPRAEVSTDATGPCVGRRGLKMLEGNVAAVGLRSGMIPSSLESSARCLLGSGTPVPLVDMASLHKKKK